MTIYKVTINGREVCRTDNYDAYWMQRYGVHKTLMTMRFHFTWAEYDDGTDYSVDY